MKRLKIGTAFTIFLLFFGISVLEAFKTRNWLAVTYWVLIGAFFLILGSKEGSPNHKKQL